MTSMLVGNTQSWTLSEGKYSPSCPARDEKMTKEDTIVSEGALFFNITRLVCVKVIFGVQGKK